MLSLVVIEVMTPSGHLSNINEIQVGNSNITFFLELSDDEARYLTDLSNYLEGRQEKSK